MRFVWNRKYDTMVLFLEVQKPSVCNLSPWRDEGDPRLKLRGSGHLINHLALEMEI